MLKDRRRPLTYLLLFILILTIYSVTVYAYEIDEIVQVTRVIDGDSFEVSGDEVRLADVSAPEWNMPGGTEATNALSNLISGEIVYLDTDQKSGRDPYGRLIAVVYIIHNSTHYKNVNEALLQIRVVSETDYTNNEFSPSTWKLFERYAPPAPPSPVPVTQTVPLEGNLTFTFYPDESIKMKVTGNIEQAIEAYSAPPVYNAYLNLASSPSGVNLTDVTGTFVLKLSPMYSMLLAALDLDIKMHSEGLSSNTTILFNMPGYLGVTGTTGAFTDEATGENNLDVDLTATIWYSVIPEEAIQGYVEMFTLLESQIVTQISELTEGNITVQDLTFSEERGFASATITITGSLVGDFIKGGNALSTNLLPLLGLEDPETTSYISPEDLMYTKAKSTDIHIRFDRNELAFLMDSEGVIEGDLDRQINIMKDTLLEQYLQYPDTPPEWALIINDVLLPTDISRENLDMAFEYLFDGEKIKLDFAVEGLGFRPPTIEAFLTFLDKALTGGSLPDFSLVFEGGSDEEGFVEIEVPATTSEPVVEEPRMVVWIVDNLADLNLVSFNVREWPTLTLTVSQTEVVKDDTVNIEGILSIEGESLEGQEVDIAVNDMVMGTVETDHEGVFSFTYKFVDTGSHEVKSSCEYYEKTLESPSTLVTVKSASFLSSELVVPAIGIVVAVAVVGYLLMKRR